MAFASIHSVNGHNFMRAIGSTKTWDYGIKIYLWFL